MEPPDSHHAINPQPDNTALRGFRILLVDDYTDTHPRLPNLIRSWGCIVEVCYTDRQCVELAAAFQPDALLISLGVISVNDVWIVRTLRGDGTCPTQPFVALARQLDDTLRTSRRADGFAHVFHRHDELPQLYAALLDVAERKR